MNNLSSLSSDIYYDILYLSTEAELFEQLNGEGNSYIDIAMYWLDEIKDIYWKIEALVAIYYALIKFNQAKAKEVLDLATSLSKQVYDPFFRAKSKACVALAILKTDPESSWNMAEEAVKCAESIEDEFHRELAIYSVVKVIAPVNPSSALELLKTQYPTPSSNNLLARNEAFFAISKEFSKTNSISALEVASLIEDQDLKDEVLIPIVQGLLFLNPKEAFRLLREIKDPLLKSKAIYKNASVLCKKNLNWLKKSLDMCIESKDIYWKSKTLLKFLNAFLEGKSAAKAKLSLETIMRTAIVRIGAITDPFPKSRLLSELSVQISRIDPNKAILFAENAFKNANLIDDPFSKIIALLDVSRVYTFLELNEHPEDLLITIIQKIEDSSMKNQAIIITANWMLETRENLQEQQKIIEQHKDKLITEEELIKMLDDFRLAKALESFL